MQMGGVDMQEMTEAMAAESGMGAVISTLGNINWGQMILAFVIYFALGYLLYASLFAAIGSAVENEADTNQLQLPVTIPLMLAFFVALYIQCSGQPCSMVGIDDTVDISYCHACAYSFRSAGMGIGFVDCTACRYIRGMRLVVGEDL